MNPLLDVLRDSMKKKLTGDGLDDSKASKKAMKSLQKSLKSLSKSKTTISPGKTPDEVKSPVEVLSGNGKSKKDEEGGEIET